MISHNILEILNYGYGDGNGYFGHGYGNDDGEGLGYGDYGHSHSCGDGWGYGDSGDGCSDDCRYSFSHFIKAGARVLG